MDGVPELFGFGAKKTGLSFPSLTQTLDADCPQGGGMTLVQVASCIPGSSQGGTDSAGSVLTASQQRRVGPSARREMGPSHCLALRVPIPRRERMSCPTPYMVQTCL